MDTATSEYLFCCDFFEDESVFRELFAPIVSVVEGDLANALQVRQLRLGGRAGGSWICLDAWWKKILVCAHRVRW